MNEELVDQLCAAQSERDLKQLVRQNRLTIESLAQLKEISAQHYRSEPKRALAIAACAKRISLLLTPPCVAFGKWIHANALIFNEGHHAALNEFQEARRLYLQEGNTIDAARLSIGLIVLLAYLRDPHEALLLADEIEPILREAGETRRLSFVHNNRGIVYDLLGRYEESLTAYDCKLEIIREYDDQLGIAQVHLNRARVLMMLNAWEETKSAFEQAEVGLEACGATVDLTRLYLLWGFWLARCHRYEEAEQRLSQSLEILDLSEMTVQMRAHTLFYRALNGMISRSMPATTILADLSQAQKLFDLHGPALMSGFVLLAIGRCYRSEGNDVAAEFSLLQAKALAQQYNSYELHWQILYEQSLLSLGRGERREAVLYSQQAIEEIESARHEFQTELFRTTFFEDKRIAYQILAELHFDEGQDAIGLEVLERACARLLAERLQYRVQNKTQQLAHPDQEELTRNIARELQETLSHIDKIDRENRQGRSIELQISGLHEMTDEDNINALRQQANSFVRQLQKINPIFAPLAAGDCATVSQIQSSLSPKTSILFFYEVNQKIGCAIIDRFGLINHPNLGLAVDVQHRQARLSNDLEKALFLYERLGRDRIMGYLPKLLQGVQKEGKALYELLLAPLWSELNLTEQIIIITNGELHPIPFHALRNDRGYLIEQVAVSYMPSLTVLDLVQQTTIREVENMLLAGFGGERLPKVRDEIDQLSAQLPSAMTLYEEDCSAENLLRLAPSCQLLHLSCHAHFRADNVMLSYFELSDGQLTLAEIASLHLKAELVTLSACETGTGRLSGSDVLSLAGSFFGSGAKSLLVSLWRVDEDATIALMTRFYRALSAGITRVEALRQAQQALLDDSLYQHPAFWAAFTLHGRWQQFALKQDR